jgi:hypothetical protein
VSSRIVLIGPADALPALQDRLDSAAEVQTFSDHEALEALDHIIRTRPGVIAMQEEFAASSRGIALINRINDDPALSACEVRVLARDAAKPRVAAKRGTGGGGGGAAIAVDEPKPALDVKGTRRAPRIRIKDGVDVAVDGNPAALVDLSTFGAQVVSATVLKPNQRVRITMSDGKIRCAGAVAWASFEMPKGAPTRYRAGIDFGTSADASSVTKFAQKHKKDKDKDR